MSTRRRIGVSTATTEAARRQLMQPVQSWEKVWTTADITAPTNSSSTIRVYKWVRSSKPQHFSDDEGEADEPLAPLPDEGEADVVEGDEDEQEDTPVVVAALPETTVVVAPPVEEEPQSKPASPKPQLSMELQPMVEEGIENDDLEPSLQTMEDAMGQMDQGVDLAGDSMLDMSVLGPDGLGLESAHDLTQLDSTDALLGGPLQMDESEDPFAAPMPDL
ncbi:unnamed protein product [Mycena citricolor]|uniref:Uncharacterized protein n=1 Tax=Mycena citricolor TaxID=2018698 RepID=A0AAD2HUJ6_9AGAR|nr:unnamed protein product [Mycena citricolor]